jgi:hypothetical protein
MSLAVRATYYKYVDIRIGNATRSTRSTENRSQYPIPLLLVLFPRRIYLGVRAFRSIVAFSNSNKTFRTSRRERVYNTRFTYECMLRINGAAVNSVACYGVGNISDPNNIRSSSRTFSKRPRFKVAPEQWVRVRVVDRIVVDSRVVLRFRTVAGENSVDHSFTTRIA